MPNDKREVGDDTIEEHIDTLRNAMRGYTRRNTGRRRMDEPKLKLRDWIGYAIAVLSPAVLSLLVTWRTVGILEAKIERLEGDIVEMKEVNREQWRHISANRD